MEDRNRDLVLSPNEYAFVLDTTKGLVSSVVGSYKLSLSNSDKIVCFNEKTKRFEEADSSNAINTFVTAPENWYITLYNPAKNNEHPRIGTSNTLPELRVGEKVNICGPASFALFPGQMARVIRGHSLKSNQYLIVRAYNDVEIGDVGYTIGDRIIIKGTDESFFIPETGFEVIPDSNGEYVRDSVTLRDLEYAILTSENGKKRYVHGPSIVFPEVDETFVVNTETNTPIFKAIELSDISGIYIKVVADYYDKDVVDEEHGNVLLGDFHPAGEELFITGKEQKIYYPRAEHAIITYDGKVMHHAIAIPAGEGRYVLDRLTGNVEMVVGPKMYLPDPRYKVILRRILSRKECEQYYPNNKEVLEYNTKELEKKSATESSDVMFSFSPDKTITFTASNANLNTATIATLDWLDNGFSGQTNVVTDKKSGFNRGNTYSKPRTITIDNKFDGVVTIEVWTGYAINVISKNGERKVIVGPQTYLLGYDETLESVDSLEDGELKSTVFLKVENNKIGDNITVQTNDFVDIDIALSYCVDFADHMKDKWFSNRDYVTHLGDYERAAIKKAVKNYSLEEFYNNAANIIRDVVVPTFVTDGDRVAVEHYFSNGMYVNDVEVFDVHIINSEVKRLFDRHQAEIVSKSLELSSGNKELEVTRQLEKINNERLNLELQRAMHEIEVKNKTELEKLIKEREIASQRDAMKKAEKEAENDIQKLLDNIHKSELAREKATDDQQLAYKKEHDKLDTDRQKAFTDSIKKVIDSISPDLVAAMTTSSKADMLKSVAESLAPYALAGNGESVADVVDKLVRGTAMEGLLDVVVKDE